MRNKIFLLFVMIATLALTAQSQSKTKDKSPVVTLSATTYQPETSKGLVFVDFWAAWCAPCRRLAPILEEIAHEYIGSVKIGKLNVENYKKLAIEQKVEALPTIIIYKDGKEMERVIGLVKKQDLVKLIEKYSNKK